jgi:hypothetical protein
MCTGRALGANYVIPLSARVCFLKNFNVATSAVLSVSTSTTMLSTKRPAQPVPSTSMMRITHHTAAVATRPLVSAAMTLMTAMIDVLVAVIVVVAEIVMKSLLVPVDMMAVLVTVAH